MFFEAWLLLGILVGGVLALIVWRSYINRKVQSEYRWQPEQDYDVVQRGETAMTPPFPELKKRKKPSKPNHTGK